MSFVGPVNRLGDGLVRPHDLVLSRDDDAGGIEAMVARVVHLGFEVRVELTLSDSSPLSAQITREEADELELSPGDIVYVRTEAARVQREPSPQPDSVGDQESGSFARFSTAGGSESLARSASVTVSSTSRMAPRRAIHTRWSDSAEPA